MIETADELVATLAETGVQWDPQRWRNFLELTPDEQALEVQMVMDSGEPPTRSTWTDVLAILVMSAKVVGVVAGIASGIGGIAGAISAVQSTVKGL